MKNKFCVSTSTKTKYGTRYECNPIDREDALFILIQNGWKEEEAEKDLDACPDQWILVNSNTQIC